MQGTRHIPPELMAAIIVIMSDPAAVVMVNFSLFFPDDYEGYSKWAHERPVLPTDGDSFDYISQTLQLGLIADNFNDGHHAMRALNKALLTKALLSESKNILH
jgi:hypothetical protein